MFITIILIKKSSQEKCDKSELSFLTVLGAVRQFNTTHIQIYQQRLNKVPIVHFVQSQVL